MSNPPTYEEGDRVFVAPRYDAGDAWYGLVLAAPVTHPNRFVTVNVLPELDGPAQSVPIENIALVRNAVDITENERDYDCPRCGLFVPCERHAEPNAS